MKAIIFLVVISTLGYCSNSPKFNERTEKNVEGRNLRNDTLFSYYKYEDEVYKQIAKIKNISTAKIHFEIETVNKILKIGSVLKGDATRDVNAIPENDLDESGNSYYCYEYRFREENCKINIRIEKDTQTRLKIKQAYCDTLGMNKGLYSLRKMLVKIVSE